MNRTMQKVVTAAVLLVLVVVCLYYAYREIWIPNKTLQDYNWLMIAPSEEIREVSHKVIRFPIGNHHDAFLNLMVTGNAESVPLLIAALRWHETAAGDDFVVCTTVHCLAALKSLTGADAGTTYKEWHRWWRETGSVLPDQTFFPRVSQIG